MGIFDANSTPDPFAQLDSHKLPPGEWVRGVDGQILAWVSTGAIDENVRQQAIAAWPNTGLWPLLADVDTGQGDWLDELQPPAATDATDATATDEVTEIFAERWAEVQDDFDPFTAPGTRAWQNADFTLTPANDHATPTPAQLMATAGAAAHRSTPVATTTHLLLVPATQPADAIRRLGWDGACNHELSAADLTAIAQSWQDRFGAVLVAIGADTLTFQLPAPVGPPHSGDILREHLAVCATDVLTESEVVDACADAGTQAQWQFWWD